MLDGQAQYAMSICDAHHPTPLLLQLDMVHVPRISDVMVNNAALQALHPMWYTQSGSDCTFTDLTGSVSLCHKRKIGTLLVIECCH